MGVLRLVVLKKRRAFRWGVCDSMTTNGGCIAVDVPVNVAALEALLDKLCIGDKDTDTLYDAEVENSSTQDEPSQLFTSACVTTKTVVQCDEIHSASTKKRRQGRTDRPSSAKTCYKKAKCVSISKYPTEPYHERLLLFLVRFTAMYMLRINIYSVVRLKFLNNVGISHLSGEYAFKRDIISAQ